MWHELSHASHYEKVGKWYWLNYITAITTNGGYGDGDRNIDGYIGVGEQWGNYFGNYVCCRDYFGTTQGWNRNEDWYNPGFLMQVDTISDITTKEIFDCLDKHTISDLKNKLKTKTSNDAQVDSVYYDYTDWP